MSIVFYLNPGATDDVCDVVREALPARWTLATSHGGDFAPYLGACDFILVADHPVTAQHIAAAPRLKMIQHQGVGYERIDLEACRARGIPVALTPEGTSVGVAEHTVLLILALYKRLLTAAGGVRRGEWHQWDLRGSSFELCGKTVGLVGYGRIGREVARRVRAFDARVRTFDPLLAAGVALDPPVDRAPSLPDLLASADIVSLHLPMRAETRHLIGRGALAQMKPGAVLVNTARGGLVDEAALFEALSNGRLAGAAVDVLEQEPPPVGHPLLAFEQVLVTPHIAAGTVDALRAKMRAAFANLHRCAVGEPLRHVVPELAELARPQLTREELIWRYRALSSPTVFNVLDKMGRPNQALSSAMRPLARGHRIAGPALTIRGSSVTRVDGRWGTAFSYDMFRAIAPGDVILFDCGGHTQGGPWGGNTAATARVKGAAGIVIDGGTRDETDLVAMAFPTWCRFLTPVLAHGRFQVHDFNQPIAMTGQVDDRVTVHPGDLVVADDDGIVVVPAAIAEEVLEFAEAGERAEGEIRRAIEAGEDRESIDRRIDRWAPLKARGRAR